MRGASRGATAEARDGILPSLRDLGASIEEPGTEVPGYFRVVPTALRRNRARRCPRRCPKVHDIP